MEKSTALDFGIVKTWGFFVFQSTQGWQEPPSESLGHTGTPIVTMRVGNLDCHGKAYQRVCPQPARLKSMGALERERPVHSRADLLIVVGDKGAMGTCGFAKVPQLGWFLRSQAT
jgi:hypothetical protein